MKYAVLHLAGLLMKDPVPRTKWRNGALVELKPPLGLKGLTNRKVLQLVKEWKDIPHTKRLVLLNGAPALRFDARIQPSLFSSVNSRTGGKRVHPR